MKFADKAWSRLSFVGFSVSVALSACGGEAVQSEPTADIESQGSGGTATSAGSTEPGVGGDHSIDVDDFDTSSGAPAPACGCEGDDFYVEIQYSEITQRFERPPAVDALPGDCGEFLQPSVYQGGSCLSTQVAACDELGDCVRFSSSEFEITTADGLTLFDLFSPDLVTMNGPSNSDAPGTVKSRTFSVYSEQLGVITGSYSACVIDADYCLK